MQKRVFILLCVFGMGLSITGADTQKKQTIEQTDWKTLYKKVVSNNAATIYKIIYLHEKLPKNRKKILSKQIAHDKKLLNTWKAQYKLTFKKEQISARTNIKIAPQISAHEFALIYLKLKLQCLTTNIDLLRTHQCTNDNDEVERRMNLRHYILEKESVKATMAFIAYAIKYKK